MTGEEEDEEDEEEEDEEDEEPAEDDDVPLSSLFDSLLLLVGVVGKSPLIGIPFRFASLTCSSYTVTFANMKSIASWSLKTSHTPSHAIST